MDKIILVFYTKFDKSEDITHINDRLYNLSTSVADKYPDIYTFYVPIFEGDTRIECINPKLIGEDEYLKVKKILEENQKIVDNLLKNGIS